MKTMKELTYSVTFRLGDRVRLILKNCKHSGQTGEVIGICPDNIMIRYPNGDVSRRNSPCMLMNLSDMKRRKGGEDA